MKTLSATQARNHLGALLKRALAGEDIGIVYSATGQIVALRPVEVYSEDYALVEYGFTDQEMKRAIAKINKLARNEQTAKWDATIKSLRG